MRRVVITGLGVIAPTGVTADQAWDTALAARSCVAEITQFDASELSVRFAAEVHNFDPAAYLEPKEARRSSRFVQFATAAVHDALADSGVDLTGDTDRIGCSVGVGVGAFGEIEQQSLVMDKKGPHRVSPLLIPYSIPNMAAGIASIATRLRGPNLCTATACASGSHAIGEAFLHILQGTADVMAAGGAESTVCPLIVVSFDRMGALSNRNDAPSQASRPFDRQRDGFVIGEGAGVVVLEELEHARRRGAKIYAELVGYGITADAHHITTPSPNGEGARRAMAMALNAGRAPHREVDYINAHGTSTQLNDAYESAAIHQLFGSLAPQISVSSTKGVTGHCLGAAGGIEAVYTVMAIERSVIPPTANYEHPDPACTLDYTPREPRERKIRYALSNSFGFGGQNACLAFKRFS